MLRIDILTIFPELFGVFLETAFVGLARKQGLARVEAHDLRDWAQDRHRSVDDSPYGGGPGMVMTPEPLVPAIEAIAGAKGPNRKARVVCLSPQGEPLTQSKLAALAAGPPLLLVCGRYEGIDQRILDLAVDEEISIGDYVLSGGEVPAMALVEGIVRLLPGVLGNPESIQTESFQGGALLEGPQYTRPPIYRGLSVPSVLRSGDHAAIDDWRRKNAQARTRERRPDLLGKAGSGAPLDQRDKELEE
jgi:tRNA (guanine37-N1)-methyltransferase